MQTSYTSEETSKEEGNRVTNVVCHIYTTIEVYDFAPEM